MANEDNAKHSGIKYLLTVTSTRMLITHYADEKTGAMYVPHLSRW